MSEVGSPGKNSNSKKLVDPIDVDNDKKSQQNNHYNNRNESNKNGDKNVDTYDIAEKIGNTLLTVTNDFMVTHLSTSRSLNECTVMLNALQKELIKKNLEINGLCGDVSQV